MLQRRETQEIHQLSIQRPRDLRIKIEGFQHPRKLENLINNYIFMLHDYLINLPVLKSNQGSLPMTKLFEVHKTLGNRCN